MMKEVTLFVKASNLTSVGKTGVEGEDTFLTEWGREEKLAEVLGKDFDSLFVGTLLAQGSKFIFNARIDKTFEGVFNGLANEGLTNSVSTYKLSGEACDTFLAINRDAYTQDAQCLTTTHGKKSMAIASAERFGEIEVISELLCLLGVLHLLDDLRCDDSPTLVSCADGIACLLVLGDNLGNDVQSQSPLRLPRKGERSPTRPPRKGRSAYAHTRG